MAFCDSSRGRIRQLVKGKEQNGNKGRKTSGEDLRSGSRRRTRSQRGSRGRRRASGGQHRRTNAGPRGLSAAEKRVQLLRAVLVFPLMP